MGGEGLVGREVLMDFRLVSQFLFTQEWWGRDETKRKNKHKICAHTHTHTVARTDHLIYGLFIYLLGCLLCQVVK